MKEAVSTSEMSVDFYQTARRSIPGDSQLYTCSREKVKSRLVPVVLISYVEGRRAQLMNIQISKEVVWNIVHSLRVLCIVCDFDRVYKSIFMTTSVCLSLSLCPAEADISKWINYNSWCREGGRGRNNWLFSWRRAPDIIWLHQNFSVRLTCVHAVCFRSVNDHVVTDPYERAIRNQPLKPKLI
jgi:hypothetical protein